MAGANIWVFVNEDETGDAVALLLEGAELIEINGELYPAIEMSPRVCLLLVEAVLECSDRVVRGMAEDGPDV